MSVTIEVKDVQAVLPVSAAWNAKIIAINSELVIYNDAPQETLEMGNIRVAMAENDYSDTDNNVVEYSTNKERILNIETKNSKIAIDEAISEQGTLNITGDSSKVLFFQSQRAIGGNNND